MSGVMEFSPLGGIWEIMELLGQGSYGKVYRAKRSELGEDYYAAIKHISVPQDEFYTDSLYENGVVTDQESLDSYYSNMLQSLMNEIKTSYRLKGYTNIVGYEDHYVFPKKGGPGYDLFIRMELLQTLHARIKEAPFTEKDIMKLGVDLCSALEVLGRENILHRDIKPSNIFVNNAGEYKLGDFGVARVLDRTTGGVSIRGTFEYMAPELQRGSTIDSRADIYSLGLVLYHLCNGGRGPFLKPPPTQIDFTDSEKAAERRLRGDALPAPVNASIALSKVILTATQFDPDNRYNNATEMKNALLTLFNSDSAEPAEEEGRTVSIFDGANTFGKSAGASSGGGRTPVSQVPPYSPGNRTNTPPYNQNPRQPNQPQYTASKEQSAAQQPAYSHGMPYQDGSMYPAKAPARKSFINIPVIVILALILMVVTVGVFLLFVKDKQDVYAATSAEDVSASAEDDEPEASEDTQAEDAAPGAGKEMAPLETSVPSEEPAPAAAPVSSPAPTAEAPNEYILADSQTRRLYDNDFEGLDEAEITLARYEIFARHHCMFSDGWVQNHFDGCSWYTGYVSPDSFNKNVLSAIELSNLTLLKERELALTGYILPESSSRYVTIIDLVGLDLLNVKLARNEIYARHGRQFSVDWVRAYFESCPWYRGTIDPEYFDKYCTGQFNPYELQNINTIMEYENTF